MIVVSDTSPLTALLTIGQAEILTVLFKEVVIPPAVQAELLRTHQTLPQWLRVEAVNNAAEVLRFAQMVPLGEAEAIELARQLRADRLLIDDRKGRRLATRESVPVIGLVGVILLARRKGLVASVREMLQRLDSEAGIYLDAKTREDALRSVGE